MLMLLLSDLCPAVSTHSFTYFSLFYTITGDEETTSPIVNQEKHDLDLLIQNKGYHLLCSSNYT